MSSSLHKSNSTSECQRKISTQMCFSSSLIWCVFVCVALMRPRVWYDRLFTKYPETGRITQSREDSICLCACAEQTSQFREHQGSS